MSEQREALAEALSQHAWLSSDEQKIGDEWIWGLNCECGEFIPDAEANAHLAGALLASPALARLLADADQRGAARGWDEGAHAGRTYQQRLQEHAHWSHIGRRLPEPISNPYRAALTTGAADRVRAEGGVVSPESAQASLDAIRASGCVVSCRKAADQ